ncbi:hypothetical protein [Bartonella apis]|uniref:hypothetical protein n=1 Tax=Bartonella apis TaxID=1686310 RepID=UPI00095F8AE8|nr:hypothetical protein [Bartonella apis]OLY47482.1 hypothetical protein PEB0122_014930 [Bartonella apis]
MKNHDKVKPVLSLSQFFTIETGQDNVGLNDDVRRIAIFCHKHLSSFIGLGHISFSCIRF